MVNISERIDKIKENIAAACARSGRNTSDVKLVVVTKSADFDSIRKVLQLGYTNLGENHVQQLKKNYTETDDFIHSPGNDLPAPVKINWHLIGHLQRNKVRQVLPMVSLIHSVDTLRLAEEINEAAARLDLCPQVLLQVNCSNEPQKYGVQVGAALHMAEQIETLPNLNLVGLMTMAPLTRNKDIVRESFARAAELLQEMQGEKIVGPDFKELSMGMSSDYEVAVEEGATILRIGSAIFAGGN
jgi:PLP dependent protein